MAQLSVRLNLISWYKNYLQGSSSNSRDEPKYLSCLYSIFSKILENQVDENEVFVVQQKNNE